MAPPNIQELLQGMCQQVKDQFSSQPGLLDNFDVFKILRNLEHRQHTSSGNRKGLLLHFPYPFSFIRGWKKSTQISELQSVADSRDASSNDKDEGSREANKAVHISKEEEDVEASITDRGILNNNGLHNFSTVSIITEREHLRSVAGHDGNQSHDPDHGDYVRSSMELQLLQKKLDNMDLASAPASKETLGRGTWIFLHTLAAQFPEKPTRQQQRDVKELMAILSRLYPCKECADHFKEVLKANPVQAGSEFELVQWMCRVHNVVNRSLGKPIFPCQRVDARWGALVCDEGVCSLQGRMH